MDHFALTSCDVKGDASLSFMYGSHRAQQLPTSQQQGMHNDRIEAWNEAKLTSFVLVPHVALGNSCVDAVEAEKSTLSAMLGVSFDQQLADPALCQKVDS